eukprot:12398244-Karenia_brevis.AAC.1
MASMKLITSVVQPAAQSLSGNTVCDPTSQSTGDGSGLWGDSSTWQQASKRTCDACPRSLSSSA